MGVDGMERKHPKSLRREQKRGAEGMEKNTVDIGRRRERELFLSIPPQFLLPLSPADREEKERGKENSINVLPPSLAVFEGGGERKIGRRWGVVTGTCYHRKRGMVVGWYGCPVSLLKEQRATMKMHAVVPCGTRNIRECKTWNMRHEGTCSLSILIS